MKKPIDYEHIIKVICTDVGFVMDLEEDDPIIKDRNIIKDIYHILKKSRGFNVAALEAKAMWLRHHLNSVKG